MRTLYAAGKGKDEPPFFGDAMDDDRFTACMCGHGFSTGVGKDKQTPYGATTNHGNFGVWSCECGFWCSERARTDKGDRFFIPNSAFRRRPGT